MSRIEKLATEQLDAYNASDLEAFVACYHPNVRVLKGDKESLTGREAFRERYRTMFESWEFGASVPHRITLGTIVSTSRSFGGLFQTPASGLRVKFSCVTSCGTT